MRATLELAEYRGGHRLVVWLSAELFAALFDGRDAEEGRVDVSLDRDAVTVKPLARGRSRLFPHTGRGGRQSPVTLHNAGLYVEAPGWLHARRGAVTKVVLSVACDGGSLRLPLPHLWTGMAPRTAAARAPEPKSTGPAAGGVSAAEAPRPDPVGPRLPRVVVPAPTPAVAPEPERAETPRVYTRVAPRAPRRAREGHPWVDPAWSMPVTRPAGPGVPLGFPGDPPPGRSALDLGYSAGSGLVRRD